VHAPKLIVTRYNPVNKDSESILVALMSLEEYGSVFLRIFLEGTPSVSEQYSGSFNIDSVDQDIVKSDAFMQFSKNRILLSSIPEQVLVDYARKHSLPLIELDKDDVRNMLDSIAQKQPQTYFSLAKSAKRLLQLKNR
jgi:hypothetical protein